MFKVQASKSQVLLRNDVSPRDNSFCYSFLWHESAWSSGEKRDIFIVNEPVRDKKHHNSCLETGDHNVPNDPTGTSIGGGVSS